MTLQPLELRLVPALQRYQTLQRQSETRRDSAALMQRCLAELGAALNEIRVALEVITEARQRTAGLEAELIAERDKYQTLLNEMPDAYIVSRPDTTILEVNRAGAELFNVSQRFLVGKPLSTFVCEDRAQFLTASLRVSQDGENANLILKVRPRERAPLTIDARVKGDSNSLRWILKVAG